MWNWINKCNPRLIYVFCIVVRRNAGNVYSLTPTSFLSSSKVNPYTPSFHEESSSPLSYIPHPNKAAMWLQQQHLIQQHKSQTHKQQTHHHKHFTSTTHIQHQHPHQQIHRHLTILLYWSKIHLQTAKDTRENNSTSGWKKHPWRLKKKNIRMQNRKEHLRMQKRKTHQGHWKGRA